MSVLVCECKCDRYVTMTMTMIVWMTKITHTHIFNLCHGSTKISQTKAAGQLFCSSTVEQEPLFGFMAFFN